MHATISDAFAPELISNKNFIDLCHKIFSIFWNLKMGSPLSDFIIFVWHLFFEKQ